MVKNPMRIPSENVIESGCSLLLMGNKPRVHESPIAGEKSLGPFEMLRKEGMNKGAAAATLSYIGDMKILGLLDKWTEVTCADGSKARILKDPSDAFELYAKEWTTKFSVVMDLLNNLKADGDVTVNSKIVHLFGNLNYINAALQEMYKNAYLTFAATPCSESAQEEKRRMDRLVAAIGLSLLGFKVLLEDPEHNGIDSINGEILKLIDRIVTMIETK